MREVLFKHLSSVESRKKDILLKEVFEKDGVIARTERRCFYFIKDVANLKKGDDLQNWLDSHEDNGRKPTGTRHFHIRKEHNDWQNQDKLFCKIAGVFYAVVDKKIYTIAFLHSFKVSFVKANCIS